MNILYPIRHSGKNSQRLSEEVQGKRIQYAGQEISYRQRQIIADAKVPRMELQVARICRGNIDFDKQNRIIKKPVNTGQFRLDFIGAFDETRTHTTFVTTPSRWRVYQFHHEGAPIFIQSEALKHQRMVALYTKKYSCVCCCITHRHFL